MGILIQSIIQFGNILRMLIFARIILSWIPLGNNAVTRLIYATTEPLLGPIRRLIQRSPLGGPGMMLDFSPVILFILIPIVTNILVGFLSSL